MASPAFISKTTESPSPEIDSISTGSKPEPICFSILFAHALFVLAEPGQLQTTHIQSLRRSFSEICLALGAELLEIYGIGDQLHLLIRYSSTVSLTSLLQKLHGVDSGAWRWNPAFFVASCQSPDITHQMKRYLKAIRANEFSQQ